MYDTEFYEKDEFDRLFWRIRTLYTSTNSTTIEDEYKALKQDFLLRGKLPIESEDWELEKKS